MIIVAGGRGSRMKSELPKQFLPLAGRPVLMHTVERFYEALPEARLIVVLPGDLLGYWQQLCAGHGFRIDHEVCAGGETRFGSVRNGLALAGRADYIAVHDGARPLVSREVILGALDCAVARGTGVPAIVPCDSFRMMGSGAMQVVDRDKLRAIQTPQVFRAGILREAYEYPISHAIRTMRRWSSRRAIRSRSATGSRVT